MQQKQYKRIQLKVDAIFEKDGSLIPKKILCEDQTFDITRILDVRKRCPIEVGCVAPLQYTVRIDDQERRIYFEPDSNSWFSVKEVLVET